MSRIGIAYILVTIIVNGAIAIYAAQEAAVVPQRYRRQETGLAVLFGGLALLGAWLALKAVAE